jgi:hypothetical protein
MIKNHEKQRFIFPLGSPLPTGVLIFSYALLLVGIIQLFDNTIVGIPIILFAGYLAFQFQGTEVDLKEKRLRFYTSFLGIRFGKWQPLESFPFICVIKRKTAKRTYAPSMQSVDEINDFYSVVILSKNHRTKLVLVNKGDFTACAAQAEDISKAFELPVVQYNPQRSEATKARRRQGRR